MTKGQEHYLNMVNAVVGQFDKTPAIGQKNSVLAQQVETLRATGNEIQQTAIVQKSNMPKGHTEAKERSREALEDKIFLTGVRVRSFADATNNDVLAAPLRFSRSALTHLKNQEIITFGRMVADTARPFLAGLTKCQVDEPMLDALKNNADEMSKLYASRDIASDDVTEATTRLAGLFARARKEIKRLDDLVEGYADDKIFITSYYASRRIHDIR